MTTPRVIHRDKFIRIGKIIVVPYKTIPMLYFDEPWGMISIISSKSCENITTHPGNFCPNLQDRLNLRFNDGAYGGDFNEKIANEILDFFEDNNDNYKLWVVHCIMGMSRSPAVAAVLGRILYNHDKDWFTHRIPNASVYKLLFNVAKKRNLISR